MENEIRETDRGLLWEHLVLDMLGVSFGTVYYWTDKEKNEIDFIVKGDGEELHTVACKINPDKYSPKSVQRFRHFYPKGKNFCFSPHVKDPYKLQFGVIDVTFQSSVT